MSEVTPVANSETSWLSKLEDTPMPVVAGLGLAALAGLAWLNGAFEKPKAHSLEELQGAAAEVNKVMLENFAQADATEAVIISSSQFGAAQAVNQALQQRLGNTGWASYLPGTRAKTPEFSQGFSAVEGSDELLEIKGLQARVSLVEGTRYVELQKTAGVCCILFEANADMLRSTELADFVSNREAYFGEKHHDIHLIVPRQILPQGQQVQEAAESTETELLSYDLSQAALGVVTLDTQSGSILELAYYPKV